MTTSENPVTAFHGHLRTLTPRAWVTPLLIVLNVAVFVAMTIVEKQPWSPSTEVLLRWGGNLGARTTSGQWWRLLTCMFLHGGVVHLAANMIVLWTTGPLVERMLGNLGFLIVYLVCGLGGAVASMAWNDQVVSVGASGAIFGLYGVLVGFLLRSKGAIPPQVLRQLQSSALFFIAYNMLFGLHVQGIDNAAHIGGLGTGFLLGLAVAHPLTAAYLGGRLRRSLAAGAGGLVILTGVCFALPKSVDLRAALGDFSAVELRAEKLYKDAVRVSDAELARRIEADVLPPFRAQQQRFLTLEQQRLPRKQRTYVHVLNQYIALREAEWTLTAKAARDQDEQALAQARTKARQAEELLKDSSKMQP